MTPGAEALRFSRDEEVERNRWLRLIAVFGGTALFFGAHFVIEVRDGKMAPAEAAVVGGLTLLMMVGAGLFVRFSSRGRHELTLDASGVTYVVGQSVTRVPLGALELLESPRSWAFTDTIHGASLLAPRRHFPRVKEELLRSPAWSGAVLVAGRPFRLTRPLRARILAWVVYAAALAYFVLMLFGLAAKAGLLP